MKLYACLQMTSAQDLTPAEEKKIHALFAYEDRQSTSPRDYVYDDNINRTLTWFVHIARYDWEGRYDQGEEDPTRARYPRLHLLCMWYRKKFDVASNAEFQDPAGALEILRESLDKAVIPNPRMSAKPRDAQGRYLPRGGEQRSAINPRSVSTPRPTHEGERRVAVNNNAFGRGLSTRREYVAVRHERTGELVWRLISQAQNLAFAEAVRRQYKAAGKGAPHKTTIAKIRMISEYDGDADAIARDASRTAKHKVTSLAQYNPTTSDFVNVDTRGGIAAKRSYRRKMIAKGKATKMRNPWKL